MNQTLLSKKTKIIIKDSKLPLFVLFLWFLGGFLVYLFILRLGFLEALKASLFLKQIEGDFSSAYNMWSQGVVFGVIFALIFQNVINKYIPERGCRMIAKGMQNHVVVIGYSHLGRRLVDYFRQTKIPYCLIEKDRDKVDDLLRIGEPVVVDNAQRPDALRDANISKAKAVIITSNDLENSLSVTKMARDYNKDCSIVTRCFQDEFAEIIESLGANEIISSSKNAFEDIIEKLKL